MNLVIAMAPKVRNQKGDNRELLDSHSCRLAGAHLFDDFILHFPEVSPQVLERKHDSAIYSLSNSGDCTTQGGDFLVARQNLKLVGPVKVLRASAEATFRASFTEAL